MKEVAVQFGDQGRLSGVLTKPEGGDDPSVVLILVSAGLTTKSGPYELYKLLARSLAEKGISVLRFDLGGLGNSEIIHTHCDLKERTRIDIADAIKFTQSNLDLEKIILCGLCSGAEDSFSYAKDDPRIRGLVLIDPHAYKTRRWIWVNIFNRRFINRVIIKGMKILRAYPRLNDENAADKTHIESVGSNLINYQYLRLEESSKTLKCLLGRDVKLYYVYTAGLIDRYNHKSQFYSMFKHVNGCRDVAVSFLPNIEHMQIFEEDRKLLITTIRHWIVKEFC